MFIYPNYSIQTLLKEKYINSSAMRDDKTS